MGPAELGQREGVREGVKETHMFLRNSEMGKAFMVASTERDGVGGVEGQMEELKNCTL